MKKIFACLTLALAIGGLAACQQQETQPAANGTQAEQPAADQNKTATQQSNTTTTTTTQSDANANGTTADENKPENSGETPE